MENKIENTVYRTNDVLAKCVKNLYDAMQCISKMADNSEGFNTDADFKKVSQLIQATGFMLAMVYEKQFDNVDTVEFKYIKDENKEALSV